MKDSLIVLGFFVGGCLLGALGYLPVDLKTGNMSIYISVSYTHLDVYKRQLQSHSRTAPGSGCGLILPQFTCPGCNAITP